MRFLAVFMTTVLLACSAFAVNNLPNVSLNEKNMVAIRGAIDFGSVGAAQVALAKAVADRGSKQYTIYLVLDSPGGDIEAGETFIEFAKTIPNLKTITMFAASMASAIAEALPGERLILESGVLMFHRARMQVSGQINEGELESRLESTKKLVTILEQRNADRLGLPLAEYKKRVVNELWMSGGPDAIEQHGADRVVSMTCSQELLTATEIVVVDLGFFAVRAKRSLCPLLRTVEMVKDAV